MTILTWTGGPTGNGGSADDPNDWNPAQAPTAGDRLVIDHPLNTISFNSNGGVTRANSFATSGNVTFAGGLLADDQLSFGSTNTGTLVVGTGTAQISINGTLSNTGTIELNPGFQGGSPQVDNLGAPAAGTLALTGGGSVILQAFSDLGFGGELINIDNTISGTGAIGGGEGFLNQGTVTMAGSIGTFDNRNLIDATGYTGIGSPGPYTNSGTLEATGSGTLDVGGAHIDNTGGTIASDGTAFVHIWNGAIITGGTLATPDNGTITLVSATLDGASSPLDNTGYLNLTDQNSLMGAIGNSGSIQLPFGYTLLNSATVTLSGGGRLLLANSLIVAENAPATLDNVDNTIVGTGTIGVALINDGAIEAKGGLLVLNNAASGTGELVVDPGATLELAAATAQGVIFNPATLSGGLLVGGTLKLDTAASYTGTIAGFGPADTIYLADVNPISVTSALFSGETLVVNIQGGGTLDYAVTGSFASDTLVVAVDAAGGSDIIVYGTTIDLAAGNNTVTVTDTTLAGGPVTISDGASGNNKISASGDTAASTGKTLSYSAGTGTDNFTGGF